MADFDLDLSAHDQQPASPKAADQTAPAAPAQLKAARKIARKSVALNSLADSLSGGVAAGNDMAVSRKTASDVADEGFSGAAHEIPHRAEMEHSFGADFSGVKAYSDGPARKASADLGAEAYAAGNQVAFNSANPDKATVAHELTHVLQHTGGEGVQRKSDDGAGGIDTSGEAQADQVEAAVRSGQPASSVLGGGATSGAGGPARKGRPARSDWGMGMTFSPEGMEKSYEYKIWEQHPPIEIPIVAVPGLNIMVEPSVKAKAAAGVDWKKDAFKAALGIEGGVGVGLSYGNASICSLYGVMEAKAFGGFEYEKTKDDWELSGHIALSTNFKVGVKLAGGIIDYGFEFGKCEIGKLTGIHFHNGHFDKSKLGWEWGEKPKEFFALIKKAIAKAKEMLAMGVDAAKAAYHKAKEVAGDVWNAVTSW